jgi:hypothetical protein
MIIARQCRNQAEKSSRGSCGEGRLDNQRTSEATEPARWALFEYKGRELVILSKPFKTKELAEKARLKYPEPRARKIGIGMVRVPIQ